MEFVGYLIRPAEWTELPPRWEEIFGCQAPLAVEIGFGNGEFLAEIAKTYKDWNWVGFETSLTCIVKTGKRLNVAGVKNVRLVLVDGRFGLRELFPDQSVQRVQLNFPCPWPKRRHAGRRLVDETFAQTLNAVLAPQGEFHLVTDVWWYAEKAARVLCAAGLTVDGPKPLPENVLKTRYERKWRSRGLSIWHLVAKAQKTGKILRIAEGTMLQAKVPTKFSSQKIQALAGLKGSGPESICVIKEIFFTPESETALLRVFSSDQGFSQHFFIVVSAHKDGLLVQLDSASLPFRTSAVKRAVALVAKALEEG